MVQRAEGAWKLPGILPVMAFPAGVLLALMLPAASP